MQTTGSLASFSWVLVVFGGLGVMVLALRWAFTPGTSLVQRRPQQGTPTEYGLLVAVAEPATFIEAEQIRLQLEAAGFRATLAPTTAGPRVMVFADDAAVARAFLAAEPPPPGRAPD